MQVDGFTTKTLDVENDQSSLKNIWRPLVALRQQILNYPLKEIRFRNEPFLLDQYKTVVDLFSKNAPDTSNTFLMTNDHLLSLTRDFLCYCLLRPDLSQVVEIAAPGSTIVLVPWMLRTLPNNTEDDTVALVYILLARLLGSPVLLSLIQEHCLTSCMLNALCCSMKNWFNDFVRKDTKLSVYSVFLSYSFQSLLVIIKSTVLPICQHLDDFSPIISLALQLVKPPQFYHLEFLRLSAFGFLCVALRFSSVMVENLSQQLHLNTIGDSLFFFSQFYKDLIVDVASSVEETRAPTVSDSSSFNARPDTQIATIPGHNPALYPYQNYLTALSLCPPSGEILSLTAYECHPFAEFGICQLGLWCNTALSPEKLKELMSCQPQGSLPLLYKCSLGVLGRYSCLLIGPPSSGKSHTLQVLYRIFNGSNQSKVSRKSHQEKEILWLYLDGESDSRSLVGSWQSGDEPGTFVWKDGILTQAMVAGRWIVIKNIDRCSLDVVSRVEEVVKSRTLFISERHQTILAHENFRLFSTITLPNDNLALSYHESLTQHFGSMCSWKPIVFPGLSHQDIEFIAHLKYPQISSLVPYLCGIFQSFISDVRSKQQPELERHLSYRVFFRFLSRVAAQLSHASLPLLESQRMHLVEVFYYTFALAYAYRQHRHYLSCLFGSFLLLTNDQVTDVIQQKQIMTEREDSVCIGSVSIMANPLQRHERCLVSKAKFTYNKVHNAVIRGVVAALVNSESVLLVGSTGTGKTSLVQKLASLLNYDLVVYNFNQQSESCDLVGRLVQKDVYSVVENFNETWISLVNKSAFLNDDQKKNIVASTQLRYSASDWKNYFCLIEKVCVRLQVHLDKTNPICGQTTLSLEWYQCHRQLNEIKKNPLIQAAQTQSAEYSIQSLQFEFEEGALIKALREGKWLVLDEINLAPPEVLQRIKGLISMSKNHDRHTTKFILTENNGEEITPHPNFRLFGCMNPSTHIVADTFAFEHEPITSPTTLLVSPPLTQSSAGKRELPADIRNAFTELFVDEITEIPDLISILEGLLPPNNDSLIERVARLYVEFLKLCAKFSIVTTLGATPHFSLRTLTRSLEYASSVISRRWMPRTLMIGLADGIIASFVTGLTRDSVTLVTCLISECLKMNKEHLMQFCKLEYPISGDKKVEASLLQLDYAIEDRSTSPPQIIYFSSETLRGDSFMSVAGKRNRDIFKAAKHLPMNQCLISPPGKKASTSSCVRWVRIEGYPIQCGDEWIDIATAFEELIITPTVRQSIRSISRILSGSRVPILLEGPTSSGKSSLVKFMCQITGHRFVRINNHDHTDVREYLGQHMIHPVTGKLIFVEGVIAQAARFGYWVILDELNLAPSEVLESLNRLLDGNRQLFIPETNVCIDAHEDFMIFATQNPSGGVYGGRKTLSTAFRNRFIEMSCQELPPEELDVILQKRCQLPPSFTSSMLQVYKELKTRRLKTSVFESSASFMTIRDLLRWGFRRPDTKEALAREGYYLIGERLRQEEEKKLIRDIVLKSCLGSKRSLSVDFDFQKDPFVLLVKQKLGYLEENKMRFSITDAMARLIALTQRAIEYKEPVLLVGETGSGKTFLCQILSLLKGAPLRIVNCHQQIEAGDLLGSLQPVKHRTTLSLDMTKSWDNIVNTVQSYRNSFRFSSDVPVTQMDDLIKLLDELVKPEALDDRDPNTEVSKETIQLDSSKMNPYLIEKRLLNLQTMLLHWKVKLIFQCEFQSQLEQNQELQHPSNNISSSCVKSDLVLNTHKRAMVLEGSTTQPTQSGFVPHAKRSKIKFPNGNTFNLEEFEIFQETLSKCIASFLESLWRSQRLFEWIDGPLTKCLKEGSFLLLDEISLADDAVLERLNSVLEPGRSLVLAEKGCFVDHRRFNSLDDQLPASWLLETIEAKDTFHVFATMNPGGDFGKRELSPALRNRFTEIWVPPIQFHSTDMLKMLHEFFEARVFSIDQENNEALGLSTTAALSFAKVLQNVVCWYNTQVMHPLSVREALSWIEFVSLFVSRSLSFSKMYSQKIHLPYIVLEGFFHGAVLICLDSFHVGNQFSATFSNNVQQSEILHFQNSLDKSFFQFLLKATREELSMFSDGDFDRLCHQFENNGFQWLYDALSDMTSSEFRSRIMDDGQISIGSFFLPCSPKVYENISFNLNDQFTCSFDFKSPTTAQNLGRVIRALQIPRSILLEGPPGAGKTSLIQSLAAVLGIELIRINLSEQTDLSDLLGADLPQVTRVSLWSSQDDLGLSKLTQSQHSTNTEAFRWVDGVLLDAMVRGSWVLLDELNLASQQVLEGLNALLDHRREIYIPELDRTIHCSNTFRLFAAQNPMRDGGGRRGIPRSFLNRFSRISISQLTEKDLKSIALSQWSFRDELKPTLLLQVDRQSDRLFSAMQAIKNENLLSPFTGSMSWDWNLRDVFRVISLLKELQPSHHVETAFYIVLLSRLSNLGDATRALVRMCKEMGCSFVMSSSSELCETSLLHQCVRALGLEPKHTAHTESHYTYLPYSKTFRLPIRSSLHTEANMIHVGVAQLTRLCNDNAQCLSQRSYSSSLFSSQSHLISKMSCALQFNWAILLTGESRTGKTACIRYLAQSCGSALHIYTLTESIDISELLGTFEPESLSDLLRLFSTEIRTLFELLCFVEISHSDNSSVSSSTATLRKTMLGVLQFLEINQCHQLDSNGLFCGTTTSFHDFIQQVKEVFSVLNFESLRHKAVLSITALERLFLLIGDKKNTKNAKLCFRWNDGLLIQCLERGDWLLLRHIENASPSLLDRLNSVLEPNGFLFLTECGTPMTIKPHPNFRLFLTADSSAVTSGRISKALHNRCLEIHFSASSLLAIKSLSLDALGHPMSCVEESSASPESFFSFMESECSLSRLIRDLLLVILDHPVTMENALTHSSISRWLLLYITTYIKETPELFSPSHSTSAILFAFYDLFKMVSCNVSKVTHSMFTSFSAVIVFIVLKLLFYALSCLAEPEMAPNFEFLCFDKQTCTTETDSSREFVRILIRDVTAEGLHRFDKDKITIHSFQEWMSYASLVHFSTIKKPTSQLWLDSFLDTCGVQWLSRMSRSSRDATIHFLSTLFTKMEASHSHPLWTQLASLTHCSTMMIEPPLQLGDESGRFSPLDQLFETVTNKNTFSRYHRLSSMFRYLYSRFSLLWDQAECRTRCFCLALLSRTLVCYFEKLQPQEFLQGIHFLQATLKEVHCPGAWLTCLVVQFLQNIRQTYTFFSGVARAIIQLVQSHIKSYASDLSPLELYDAFFLEESQNTSQSLHPVIEGDRKAQPSCSTLLTTLAKIYREALHLLCFVPCSTNAFQEVCNSKCTERIPLLDLHSHGPILLWDILSWVKNKKDNLSTGLSFVMSQKLSCTSSWSLDGLPSWVLSAYDLAGFMIDRFMQVEDILPHIIDSGDYPFALYSLSNCVEMLYRICVQQSQRCLVCSSASCVAHDANMSGEMNEKSFPKNFQKVLIHEVERFLQRGMECHFKRYCQPWLTQGALKEVAVLSCAPQTWSHEPCPSSLVLSDAISSMELYRGFRSEKEFLLHFGMQAIVELRQDFFLSMDFHTFFNSFGDLIHAKATLHSLGFIETLPGFLKEAPEKIYDQLSGQCIELLDRKSSVRNEREPGEDVFTAQQLLLVEIFLLIHCACVFEWGSRQLAKAARPLGEENKSESLETYKKLVHQVDTIKRFVLRHLCTLLHKCTARLFSLMGFLVLNGLSLLTSFLWRIEYAVSTQHPDQCRALVMKCSYVLFHTGRQLVAKLDTFNEAVQLSDEINNQTFKTINDSLVLDPQHIQSLMSGPGVPPTTPSPVPLNSFSLSCYILDPELLLAWRSTLILNFCGLMKKNVTLCQVERFLTNITLLQQLLYLWDNLSFSTPPDSLPVHLGSLPTTSQEAWVDFILEGLAEMSYRLVHAMEGDSFGDVTAASPTSYCEMFLQCRKILTGNSFITVPTEVNKIVEKSITVVHGLLNGSHADAGHQPMDPHECIIASIYASESLTVFKRLLDSATSSWSGQNSQNEPSQDVFDGRSIRVESHFIVMQLLWKVCLWRILSCVSFVGGKIRRSITLTQMLSIAQDDDQMFYFEKRFEQCTNTLLHEDLLFDSAAYFRLSVQQHQLKNLMKEMRDTLPLTPPLNVETFSSGDAVLYTSLVKHDKVRAQHALAQVELEALQKEVCQFISGAWEFSHLKKICPWMDMNHEQNLVESEHLHISSQECAEAIVFLVQNTLKFSQTLKQRYPLFSDLLDTLCLCFDLCFYSLFSTLPSSLRPLINKAALSATTLRDSRNILSAFDQATLCQTIGESLSDATSEKSLTKSNIDRVLWRCECYEYDLQHHTMGFSQLASFRHVLFDMCQLANEDEEIKRQREAEKLAHYIQNQDPMLQSGVQKEQEDPYQALANKLFPEAPGQDVDPSLCVDTPYEAHCTLSNTLQPGKNQETNGGTDVQYEIKDLASIAQNTVDQDTLFSSHQMQNFHTLLYYISCTLSSRLWRKREWCCHRSSERSGRNSFHKADSGHDAAWLGVGAYQNQTITLKLLGWTLKDYAQKPLPKDFDRFGTSFSMQLYRLLLFYKGQLSGATYFDQLKQEYETLFFNAQKSFLLVQDDVVDEDTPASSCSEPCLTDEEALALAKKNLAIYKSQKIRFVQIQRLLRNLPGTASYSLNDDATASSFYSDAWPLACMSVFPAVVSLQARVAQLLDEFPQHPALEDIRHRVETVRHLPVFSTTPVSLVHILERLVVSCEQWEKFAHRTISLKNHILDLNRHLLLLRHHQLNDWKKLCSHREELAARKAMVWTAPLVAIISELVHELLEDSTTRPGSNQNEPFSMTQDSGFKEKCQLLWTYLEKNTFSQPVGEFTARLNLIRMIGEMLQWSENDMSTASLYAQHFGYILHHFVLYCELVEHRIESWIANGRTTMDTAVRSLLKITSWDFSKPDTVKHSIQKAHYHLSKIVSSFDQHLQTSVYDALGSPSSLPSENKALESSAQPFVTSSRLTASGAPSYQSLQRLLSHILPSSEELFDGRRSNSPKTVSESTLQDFYLAIRQLSKTFETHPSMGHGHRNLGEWVTMLHQDVGHVLPLIEGSDTSCKRRWCYDLRERLKQLNFTRRSHNPDLSLIVSDTGLHTLCTVAHLALGVSGIPDPQTLMLNERSSKPKVDAPGDEDALSTTLHYCMGTSSPTVSFSSLLDLIPRLFTFLQKNFYRQTYQYTKLSAQRGLCHEDLVKDGTNVFWTQMTSTLLEMTQQLCGELWDTSQSLTECLDLVYLFSNPHYSVEYSIMSRVFSVLDSTIEALRQSLCFTKESDSTYGVEDYEEFHSAMHTRRSPNASLSDTPDAKGHQDPTVVSLMELLKAHTVCRDMMMRLPEIRMFQRDSRFSLMSVNASQRIVKIFDHVNFHLRGDGSRSTQIFHLPNALKHQILNLTTIPQSERWSLIISLEASHQHLFALTHYDESRSMHTAECLVLSPTLVSELFPFSTPFLKDTVKDNQKEDDSMNQNVSVELGVSFDDTIHPSAISPLRRLANAIKEKYLETTLASTSSSLGETYRRSTITFPDQLKKSLVYAFYLFLTTLETAVAMSGLGLFTLKVANLLFNKGYCGELGVDDSTVDGGEKESWIAGTGMGQGEGLNDVSKDISDPDLLDGYKDEEPSSEQPHRDTPQQDSSDQFGETIDAMDPTLCDAPPDSPHGEDHAQKEDIERDMGPVNLSDGEVEKKSKDRTIDDTDHKDDHSSEQIETRNADCVEKTDTLSGKKSQEEELQQEAHDLKDSDEQKGEATSKPHTDHTPPDDKEALSDADALPDTLSEAEDDPSSAIDPLEVTFKEQPQQMEEDATHHDLDENFDNLLDYPDDTSAHEEKMHDEEMPDEPDSLGDPDDRQEEENAMNHEDIQSPLSHSGESVNDDLATETVQIEPMDSLDQSTDKHENLAQDFASQKNDTTHPNGDPFGGESQGYRTHHNTTNPGSNQENETLKEPEQEGDRDSEGTSIHPTDTTWHPTLHHDPTKNSTLSSRCTALEATTSKDVPEKPFPNPLLGENQAMFQEWISRIHLTHQGTQDCSVEPLPDMNAPLPAGAECEKNDSSDVTGLAEAAEGDQKHTLEDLNTSVQNPSAQEHSRDDPLWNDDNTSLVDFHHVCDKDTDTPMESPSGDAETDPLGTSRDMKDPSSKLTEPSTSPSEVENPFLACTLRGQILEDNRTTPPSTQEREENQSTEEDEASLQEDLGVAQAKNFWYSYGLETDTSANQLCEQLRIVLEPTLRGRFAEGYRSGKRLSMRRVITFLASNFRRDQIWLRRSRPSRRDYRILIALDNSRSMSECGIGKKALKAIVTVSTAFQRLELGKTGLCSFGGKSPKVILPIDNHVYDSDRGAEIIRAFTFDKESLVSYDQALPQLFDLSFQLFADVPQPPGGTCSYQQMLLIVSDGRFNKHLLYSKVHQALAQNIIPILLIIDSALIDQGPAPHHGNNSIFNLTEAIWVGENVLLKNYLDDFPFPFYAVVQRLSSLPDTLTDVVRQWIEMLSFR